MKDVDWPSWPTATVPLAHPGLLVADRYQLRSQIGVGAMGAVWLALDQRLNRLVALKQVVLEPGLDPRQAAEARQRILREGRIAARLQNQHAVAIYDVTMHEGEPWLVMEYVPSRSLAAVLTEDGLLSDKQAARIGMQLANALDAAHRAGIVHRDVKPGNVLIGQDGTAKLVDFGIARANGDITVTQTGVLTGTPDYFAPEVARGEKPSSEADVFALGATLYICVEGQPPFGAGKNALSMLQMAADGEVVPPRRAGRLAPVLRELLAAAPADRPSAQRAALMLRAVAHAHDTGPNPIPSPNTGPTWAPSAPPTPDRVPARDPDTTQIPPPRSAPETWLPAGRALPPTPRELAASSAIGSPTGGRAAHRHEMEKRHRLTAIALVAVAALGLFGAVAALNADKADPVSAVAGTSSSAGKASEADLTATARAYFALLPREPAEAWRKLTPKAQQQLGGLSAFNGYWSDISSLRLVSTSASVGDQTVRAQLKLQTTGGQGRTTTQRLVIVPGPDDGWLIDVVGGS